MQVLINGVINGLPIALLALAFSVVYIPTRVFYLALGGIYAITPFLAWAMIQVDWPVPLAACFAILIAVGISVLCDLFNHWPLENRGVSISSHIIASLGIYIVLVQFAALLWGYDTKVLRTGIDPTLSIGDIVITGTQSIIVLVTISVLSSFYLWLRHTRYGLIFRALAENPTEFALRGYRIRWVRMMAFGMSGLLAAVSSLLVSFDIGFDPNIGLRALFLAIVGVIIGGRLSFLGAVLGGLLLGVLREEVGWFIANRWVEAVTFLLLAAFLFVRPNGIIGAKERLEART